MYYKILTTQEKIYKSFLETGLIARGIKKKIIDIEIKSLYDFADDPHHSIDGRPYGGGAGMVLRVDVMEKAFKKIKGRSFKTILLTPQGKKFDQKMAKKLAKEKGLILVAGRFEGYDERIRGLVDEEISIGDYVLTSGDLAAMVLIDSVSRHIPSFIEKEESLKEESFGSDNLTLEYPQYTRPENFKGQKVPEILLSGNHKEIADWRKDEAMKKTKKHRLDIL